MAADEGRAPGPGRSGAAEEDLVPGDAFVLRRLRRLEDRTGEEMFTSDEEGGFRVVEGDGKKRLKSDYFQIPKERGSAGEGLISVHEAPVDGDAAAAARRIRARYEGREELVSFAQATAGELQGKGFKVKRTRTGADPDHADIVAPGALCNTRGKQRGRAQALARVFSRNPLLPLGGAAGPGGASDV